MNAHWSKWILSLSLIVGFNSSVVQPVGAQITSNGGTGGLQLPTPPTVGDISVDESDHRLLNFDQSRIAKWESAIENYKATADKELAASRQALPSVLAQLDEIKGKNNKQTLAKLAGDQHSRYFQLTQWLAQEQAAEAKENETLDRYRKQIADVRNDRNSDRINIVADQHAISDNYKKYSDQAYQEQKELARWNLQQQWNLNNGWNGTAPSGYGGSGWNGWTGYAGFGGYRY